ncbi:MAG TPA: methyltransferase dimerization domain-containing protein [Tepidisphaeraceae bacterium]|jgi:hypothetical protein
MEQNSSPDQIMQLGLGFWGSKTLLGAVELGLFTLLAGGPLPAEEIGKRLNLHPRSLRDFLDALVALGMLKRTGDLYADTDDTSLFLDRNKPSYVGGILEMASARLFRFWNSLTEALHTGQQQNESKGGGGSPFDAIYSTPERLKQFLASMTGLSMGASKAQPMHKKRRALRFSVAWVFLNPCRTGRHCRPARNDRASFSIEPYGRC